ncbi:MAG: AmmeMemoRadiSam system protein A, partial [Firmicutes bacterium]|nr:AmmeMemoRadiSam system protein A [Bacillota bacterium]
YSYRTDKQLLQAIELEADRKNIRLAHLDKRNAGAYGISLDLDHGALVPLHFLQKKGVVLPLLHFTFGLLPPQELFAFGQAVRTALKRQKRRVALICSADLSHRLTPDAPYGYTPAGKEFDDKLVALIEKYDVDALLKLDPSLREEAAECGYRSIIIGLGILDGDRVQPEILSYEGPFGVGYLVADLTPNFSGKTKKEKAKPGSEQARLAKLALESFVRNKEFIEPPQDSSLLNVKAGAFVTLYKSGHLRGCIGTIEPVQESLAAEIIENAISAGMYDPRFPPVAPDELADLTYSVDVLSPAEEVSDLDLLDPRRYGVIVESNGRRGLLLPDLEGINTVEQQIMVALQKAGIEPGEPYRLFRFQVERFQ